jgi:hypothetical protein
LPSGSRLAVAGLVSCAVEADGESIRQLAAATEVPNRGLAPKSVLMALAGLLGSEEPAAVCASVEGVAGRTTWQVAAITERHVVVVQATQNLTDWALEFGIDEPEEWIASAVPIGTVSGVNVTATKDLTDATSPDDWHWTTAYEVNLGGGAGLSIPVDKQPPHYAHEESVETFVRELLKRM